MFYIYLGGSVLVVRIVVDDIFLIDVVKVGKNGVVGIVVVDV